MALYLCFLHRYIRHTILLFHFDIFPKGFSSFYCGYGYISDRADTRMISQTRLSDMRYRNDTYRLVQLLHVLIYPAATFSGKYSLVTETHKFQNIQFFW